MNTKVATHGLVSKFQRIMLALLVVVVLFGSLPVEQAAAAGLAGKRTPAPVAAGLTGKRTPARAMASTCQIVLAMGDIKIVWRECPSTTAQSGVLYRGINNGLSGWKYWGVYSYTSNRLWQYLIHRSGATYAKYTYTGQYYLWNGTRWVPVNYSQIPW